MENEDKILIDGGVTNEHHSVVLAAINLCNTLQRKVVVMFLINRTDLSHGKFMKLMYVIEYTNNAARITDSFVTDPAAMPY